MKGENSDTLENRFNRHQKPIECELNFIKLTLNVRSQFFSNQHFYYYRNDVVER